MTTLASGSSLAAGQSITSDNGKYKLELQADGKFPAYFDGSPSNLFRHSALQK